MTRKDYQVLAAALRSAYEATPYFDYKEQVQFAIEHVSRQLKNENGRFNEALFLKLIFGDKT